MSRPSRVVVLAEDARHQSLIRQYLYRRKYSIHEIYFEALPNGRGCAKQWVRDRYVKSVKACRSRSARAATALIVAIDADTGEVDHRVDQLREALEREGLAARAKGEAIAHLIPKRNVETWILCLSGKPVDENTDYRRHPDVDKLIGPAAVTFFEWSCADAAPPVHCVSSILSAFPEVKRLE